MLKIKKYFRVSILLLLISVGAIQNANALEVEDGQLIAEFIYNMVDYAAWKTRNVVICSYGHDEVSDALIRIASAKPASENELHAVDKITVKDNVSMEQVSNCNILYFAQYQDPHVLEVLDHTQKLPILTVSNIEHFVDMGGVMEFKISRQKLKLRLNKEALKRTGIALSPVILMSIKPEKQE